MQFLFVVLMSVLVGSSALPHVMQAPNRPSFSLRKNTNFSIVAIPKLFQTVASLERKIASIEEEQNRKKLAIEKAKLKESVKPSSESDNEGREESALQEPTDSTVSSEAASLKGSLIMENVDLQTCICKENGVMDCKVFLEGSCSNVDQFVSVTVKIEDKEVQKNFRCKEENHFSGSVAISGGGVGLVRVNFMDQQYEQSINMINYCGQLESTSPPTEDE